MNFQSSKWKFYNFSFFSGFVPVEISSDLVRWVEAGKRQATFSLGRKRNDFFFFWRRRRIGNIYFPFFHQLSSIDARRITTTTITTRHCQILVRWHPRKCRCRSKRPRHRVEHSKSYINFCTIIIAANRPRHARISIVLGALWIAASFILYSSILNYVILDSPSHTW